MPTSGWSSGKPDHETLDAVLQRVVGEVGEQLGAGEVAARGRADAEVEDLQRAGSVPRGLGLDEADDALSGLGDEEGVARQSPTLKGTSDETVLLSAYQSRSRVAWGTGWSGESWRACSSPLPASL